MAELDPKKKKSPYDDLFDSVPPMSPEDRTDEEQLIEEQPAEDQLTEIRGAAKPAPIPPAAKIKKSADISAASPEKAQQKQDIVAETEAMYSKIAQNSTPDLEQKVGSQIEVAKANIAPEDKRDLAWLEKRYNQLDKEYKDNKDSLEWRAALETVAQSLTQLFAARAGLREGVDMSNIKFDKTDFDKKLQNVQEDIMRRRGQAENIFAAGEKKAAEASAAATKERELGLAERAQAARERTDAQELKLRQDELNLRKSIENAQLGLKAQELAAEAAKAAQPLGVDSKLMVPGYGVARTEQEAKDFRNELTDTQSAIDILENIKKLGTNVGPLDLARRKQIDQGLNLAVGKMRLSLVGPGAMTDSERAIVRDSIGDPTKFLSTESIEKSKIDGLINQLKGALKNRSEAVIAQPISKPAESPRAELERLRALKKQQGAQ